MSDPVQAGYGEARITPPLGVELCGYGVYRERRAESVHDDLKARAVWLSRGPDSLLLIACDLIGFTVDATDAMRSSLSVELGLPTTRILLACTHTHTGPATQFLRGCGEMSPAYTAGVPALVAGAARRAREDAADATLHALAEPVSPIGYNRRNRSFAPVDPALGAIIAKRKAAGIYILNHACHPVAFGAGAAISADWPGAWIHAVEQRGHHALFLQGFCGDIDPVSNMARSRRGNPATLTALGDQMARWLDLFEPQAQSLPDPVLQGFESRISLPLQVPPSRDAIRADRVQWQARKKDQPAFARWVDAWAMEAEAGLEPLACAPRLAHVPIQRLAIGSFSVLGLPGEVFCEYGLQLRKRWPSLLTAGYAGGNVGYLPTAEAYQKEWDYACYMAPKVYALFPFAPTLEGEVQAAASALMDARRQPWPTGSHA